METDLQNPGLKCGLEVHQQLDTGKLFCRCPSVLRDYKPDFSVRRKLRPVASELGEFDLAALEAFRKNLEFVYEGYNDTTCLIELDDEPPKAADKDALETVLKICIMAGADILDEVIVMRKTVIDGSNTSGFQRTMLVSLGGKLKLKNKELGIQTIALEEDACRPSQKTGSEVFYRLDRLGIPLIELATEPGIKSPEEAREAALKIGELFRRTCKARRGLGTIRQDLNISIAEGARVEIKGVQNLDLMDEFVRREILRQQNLIELREQLLMLGVSEEDFALPPEDITPIFAGTNSGLLKKSLEKGESILAIRFPKMVGLPGMELQPNRRFGTELSDHVKAKAGLHGLMHSDELPAYGISHEEVSEIRRTLGCSEHDAFAFVVGQKEKCVSALQAVSERCVQALKGVPEETRNALDDGNTSYSRPLPGAARMYPETDIAPVRVDKKLLKELEKDLPLTVEERLDLYKKRGLSGKLANEMGLDNFAAFFESLLKKGFNATTAAVFLLEGLTQLRREGLSVDGISNETIEKILSAEKSGKILKDDLLETARSVLQGKSLDGAVREKADGKAGNKEIEEAVKRIVERNALLIKEKGTGAFAALMGDAMKELGGKASGKDISEALKRELRKNAGT
ncbi:MAG: Glu-tRNA(Gln) amidotransferase subunit GatE [Candidatus Diapherotrites archaeon]|nr:Glu-tRNA(Gln) amidotransferase subunit GatE [Candidatus Diapherotrites archaeon]